MTRLTQMLLLGLVAVALMVAALPAAAQPTTITDDDVNAVAEKLYCPTCENIPLDACGTPSCVQWKNEIRAQLAAGLSADAIIDDFVQRYGQRVVGTPLDPTLRALAFWTPWGLLVIAIGFAAYTLLRWWRVRSARATTTATASPNGTGSDTDYRTRIENDLMKLR